MNDVLRTSSPGTSVSGYYIQPCSSSSNKNMLIDLRQHAFCIRITAYDPHQLSQQTPTKRIAAAHASKVKIYAIAERFQQLYTPSAVFTIKKNIPQITYIYKCWSHASTRFPSAEFSENFQEPNAAGVSAIRRHRPGRHRHFTQHRDDISACLHSLQCT